MFLLSHNCQREGFLRAKTWKSLKLEARNWNQSLELVIPKLNKGAVRPGSGRGAPRRSAPDTWRRLLFRGRNLIVYRRIEKTIPDKPYMVRPFGYDIVTGTWCGLLAMILLQHNPGKGKDRVRDSRSGLVDAASTSPGKGKDRVRLIRRKERGRKERRNEWLKRTSDTLSIPADCGKSSISADWRAEFMIKLVLGAVPVILGSILISLCRDGRVVKQLDEIVFELGSHMAEYVIIWSSILLEKKKDKLMFKSIETYEKNLAVIGPKEEMGRYYYRLYKKVSANTIWLPGIINSKVPYIDGLGDKMMQTLEDMLEICITDLGGRQEDCPSRVESTEVGEKPLAGPEIVPQTEEKTRQIRESLKMAKKQ
ncbi:hypothetical protein L2E82_43947 [Cichorium intybus]|uniref:Uncharacterized protein n=1 Tax=Cichorium intybus TaxID=13427 RepID=A0ACB8ZPR0_CICIN|nr:hypothetical protein L2E82_43947 [Cichorium intybus]